MQIRAGYEIIYDCPQPTPIVLMLSTHPSRAGDLLEAPRVQFDPPSASAEYLDIYGNVCTRFVAGRGIVTISNSILVRDSGDTDPVVSGAHQHPVEELPDDALLYLLGSRYCDVQELSQTAWDRFGSGPQGWARVQAICDFVHDRIAFNYMDADPTRTASQAFHDRRGVCRDYAHLAITFCRCLNIPARYCTGYLGDMGTLPPYGPMDFAAWFEVYLGGAWHTFDARNNVPRIGRILIARGRDATDVAIATTFGACSLVGFKVMTDEVA